MKSWRIAVLLILGFGPLAVTVARAQVCPAGHLCGPEAPPKTDFPSDNNGPFTRGDCMDLPGHHVSGSVCVPDNPKCPIIPTPHFSDPDCRSIPITFPGAIDPNDKRGVLGAGSAQFVPGTNPLSYNIIFENLATATAPAQQVVISDQLDIQTLDLSTLSLGPIYFGDSSILPTPGLSMYSAAIDLRPEQNLIVRIDASLNKATGLLTWHLTSVDADTLQMSQDPLAGFLPPNVTPPAGQGGVAFTVTPKSGLPTGTVINNQASIVFDTNAPIATPTWSNTLDVSPPVTHVVALPVTESSSNFTVQWTGSDAGSGLGFFSIYASDNGGPFVLWQDQTNATSSIFAGQVGHTYRFYSVGQDLVGNVEPLKTVAEARTQVVAGGACASNDSAQIQVTRSGFGYNFTSGRFVQTVTLKNTSASMIAGPLSLVLDSLSGNATLFNPTGTTVCALPAGSPFVTLAGNLAVGASASLTLQFTDPSRAGISYTTRVLAGSAAR